MPVKTLQCPACGAPLPQAFAPGERFACPSCGMTLALELLPEAQTICRSCRSVNESAARFCLRCGAALESHCPFCYAANRAGAVFCRQCGANLPRARERKRAWLEEKKQYDEAWWAAWKQAEAASQKAQLQRLLDQLAEPENHPLAIGLLRQFGAEAVEALIGLLKEGDDVGARFGAARALGLIGDRRAVPALVAALADGEPVVRYWAAEALGRLRDGSAVQPLGGLARDAHKGVRERAAESLRQIGGAEAERLAAQIEGSRWWPF